MSGRSVFTVALKAFSPFDLSASTASGDVDVVRLRRLKCYSAEAGCAGRSAVLAGGLWVHHNRPSESLIEPVTPARSPWAQRRQQPPRGWRRRATAPQRETPPVVIDPARLCIQRQLVMTEPLVLVAAGSSAVIASKWSVESARHGRNSGVLQSPQA